MTKTCGRCGAIFQRKSNETERAFDRRTRCSTRCARKIGGTNFCLQFGVMCTNKELADALGVSVPFITKRKKALGMNKSQRRR